MVESGIHQIEAQSVFPVNAAAHGLCRLAVGEALNKLEHAHERQAPGGCCWTPPRWK